MEHLQGKIYRIILSAFAISIGVSCAHKSGRHARNKHVPSIAEADSMREVQMGIPSTESVPPQSSSTSMSEKKHKATIIKMRKQGGVYLVPIIVNGLNLDFIFDTGASAMSISIVEAMVMKKQGMISREDIVGTATMSDANGDISVGTIVNLRYVQIGDIVLKNVSAVVVNNIDAPLLLGQTALSHFGRVSINYSDSTMIID